MTVSKTYQVRTFGDLLWHTRRSYRQVAKVLYDGAEMTAREMAEKTGISLASVQSSLADFKNMKMAHVCRWEKPEHQPTTTLAVYKIGDGEDAPRPKPRYLDDGQTKKARAQAKLDAQEVQTQTWKDLTKLLIPKRTPQEMREVNWRYLCYLSPDAVKYAL
jgi:hypothetical protein